MSDNNNLEAPQAIAYYTPCPGEWLKKKHWSAKEGLLLLTGHNPKQAKGIDWEPSGDRYCTVHHIERLGWKNDPNPGYALYTRDQLREEIRQTNREAEELRRKRTEPIMAACRQRQEIIAELQEEIRQLDREEKEEHSVTVELFIVACRDEEVSAAALLPSLNECRDNECYSVLQRWLSHYEESEQLLDKFIAQWRDTPRNIDEEGIKVKYILKWTYDTGLYKHVPWWAEAVQADLISVEELEHEIPAQKSTPEDDATAKVLIQRMAQIENNLAPFAETGKKFRVGRKNPDPLSKLIESIYEQHIGDRKNMATKEVWDILSNNKNTHPQGSALIIGALNNKDEEHILEWEHPNGKMYEIKYEAFKKRMTNVRKKFQAKNGT